MACLNTFDIGGCGCSTTCSQTFTVTGCLGKGYPGLTVAVYASSGGALLASGTTGATGQVALSWAGTASPYVTITGQSSAWAAYGQTVAVTCGGSKTIALTLNAGYVCVGCCYDPWPTTNLHLTDSIIGAVSLAWSATLRTWSGSISYAYPGCLAFGCGGFPFGVTYTFDGCTLTVTGLPAPGGDGGCPGGSPPAVAFARATAAGCPHWSANVTDIDAFHHLYCGATATVTITP